MEAKIKKIKEKVVFIGKLTNEEKDLVENKSTVHGISYFIKESPSFERDYSKDDNYGMITSMRYYVVLKPSLPFIISKGSEVNLIDFETGDIIKPDNSLWLFTPDRNLNQRFYEFCERKYDKQFSNIKDAIEFAVAAYKSFLTHELELVHDFSGI